MQPSPNVPKSTLDKANEVVTAVESDQSEMDGRWKKRGRYGHVDSDTKFKIAKFAAEHGDRTRR